MKKFTVTVQFEDASVYVETVEASNVVDAENHVLDSMDARLAPYVTAYWTKG